MRPAAIEAEGLSKRFGRTWALAGVNLRIARGAIALFTGKNGSGKTTLFRVLSTAIRPDAGSASIDGVDIRDRDRVRRRTVLLTHQAYTYESLTATENLRMFARLIGGDDSVAELLREVGLNPEHNEPVSTFSAGMRKRLALARALVQLRDGEVSVVFLDEPYAALDAEGLDMVDGLIRRLHGDGKTVVIASHLVERCVSFATGAMLLESGRLVWSGEPAELVSRRDLRRHSLAEGAV